MISLGCPVRIAAVVGAHHGKPTPVENIDEIQVENNIDFNIGDSVANNRSAWERARKAFMEYALELSGYKHYDELPDISFSAQVLLNGILIMADWLASNEEYFPLVPVGTIFVDEQQRVSDGRNKIHISDRWNPNASQYGPQSFMDEFGFTPNAVQVAIMKATSNATQPGIYILEAQMGVGKTEAALAAAEILATKFGDTGLYFGLPTQATANGLFSRIEEWAAGQSMNGLHTIMLAHGAASLNEDYSELAQKAAGVDQEGLFVHEWFQGSKKRLLSDFVVGTIDQFLMLALKQKHVPLRHIGIAGKTVIIDECHAYDAYMYEYLCRALEWLGAYNVPVILLSATLPINKRHAMLEAYLRGCGVYKAELPQSTDVYPVLTWTNGNEVNWQAISIETVRRRVALHYGQWSDAIDKVLKVYSGGGATGIICNTIRKAQEVYDLVRQQIPDSEVKLCHAQFLMEDRAKWEKSLMDRLGKKSSPSRRNGLIVIGTQVLEQSLDIDFDYMVTEICPMDLLMQHLGRLHCTSQHILDTSSR